MLALLHFDTFCRYGDCRSASSARKYFLNTYRYRHLWLLQGLLDFTRLAWDWGKQHLRDISYLLFCMIILYIYNVWEKNLFHNSFVVAVFLWMTSKMPACLCPSSGGKTPLLSKQRLIEQLGSNGVEFWISPKWILEFWNSANTEEYGNPWKS